jgi:hypothetical protein
VLSRGSPEEAGEKAGEKEKAGKIQSREDSKIVWESI